VIPVEAQEARRSQLVARRSGRDEERALGATAGFEQGHRFAESDEYGESVRAVQHRARVNAGLAGSLVSDVEPDPEEGCSRSRFPAARRG